MSKDQETIKTIANALLAIIVHQIFVMRTIFVHLLQTRWEVTAHLDQIALQEHALKMHVNLHAMNQDQHQVYIQMNVNVLNKVIVNLEIVKIKYALRYQIHQEVTVLFLVIVLQEFVQTIFVSLIVVSSTLFLILTVVNVQLTVTVSQEHAQIMYVHQAVVPHKQLANILSGVHALQEKNVLHNTAREIHAHLPVAFLRNQVVIQMVVFVHKALTALLHLVTLAIVLLCAIHLIVFVHRILIVQLITV